MGFDTLHTLMGLNSSKCTAAEIYAISCYDQFVKTWKIATIFALVIRKSVCLFENAWVQGALKLAFAKWIAPEAKW